MSWKIGMPNLGHTMEEGKVSEWLKAVGDPVAKGEVIVIVESDKASFDVESPADGTLAAIHEQAGATVLVGASIGLVLAAGEALQAQATRPAQGASLAQQASAPGRAPVQGGAPRSRARISPAARVLAEELGVDWQSIQGTGEEDMITRDDVYAHAAAGAAGEPAQDAASASGSGAPSAMRRAIAAATADSWRTIPHVPLQTHAEVGALLQSGAAGLTAVIARACALALAEHPAFNGWWVDGAFRPGATSDIALAVSTPGGLVTAVVRDAALKSTAQIGQEIASLAASAREGRLDGAKMTGGTFTLSSLGRWGVDAFAPIISAPQVATLGVGRVDRVARETPGGAVRFASEIRLTLVFDHRANDGVEAARFLASIVACLEQPGRLEMVS